MTFTAPFSLWPQGQSVETFADKGDALLRAAHLLRRGVPSVLLDAHGLEVADYRISSPDCAANDVFGNPCKGDARWVPTAGSHLCAQHELLSLGTDEPRRVTERENAFRVLGETA